MECLCAIDFGSHNLQASIRLEEQIDLAGIGAAEVLIPVAGSATKACCSSGRIFGCKSFHVGLFQAVLFPHVAIEFPHFIDVDGIIVHDFGTEVDGVAAMDGEVEGTFDSDLRSMVGILAPWGIAPAESCLEVVHAVFEPFAQFAKTCIAIDVLIPIDLVETSAPTSVGGILVAAQAIVDAVEERRRITLADERLDIAGTERVLAIVHIVAHHIVR